MVAAIPPIQRQLRLALFRWKKRCSSSAFSSIIRLSLSSNPAGTLSTTSPGKKLRKSFLSFCKCSGTSSVLKAAYKALQATLIEVSANLNKGIEQIEETRIDVTKVNQEVRKEIQQ